MKTKEELNSLKNELESLNKKLAELTDDELKQVAGGWKDGNMSSEDVYKVMFNYINNLDEFHAVWMYRSKGFLLDSVYSQNIHYLFKQIFGHEIEESQYFE